MKHLDDGELRRLLDEPDELEAAQREHARQCAQCAARAAELQSVAQSASQALCGDAGVDTSRALERTLLRARSASPVSRLYRPLGAFAAAAAFVAALLFTPLGGYARSFLTIFQPKEFVALDLSHADFGQLRIAPQADELGTMRVIRKQQQSEFGSLAAVRPHLSFAPRVPASVPASVGTQRSYRVMSPGEYRYTFSAAKARAFEAKSHRKLAPMPPALDGTTVRIRVGESFNAQYGAAPKRGDEDEAKQGIEIVETQIPTVTSTGASFQELEQYMLSMPGVSAELKSQLREVGDLQNRMPVPIDISKQNAQSVTVDGVKGLAIGDNTGLGAGVIWQKNGIVYGVLGGALTMDQVLAVANGLR